MKAQRDRLKGKQICQNRKQRHHAETVRHNGQRQHSRAERRRDRIRAENADAPEARPWLTQQQPAVPMPL